MKSWCCRSVQKTGDSGEAEAVPGRNVLFQNAEKNLSRLKWQVLKAGNSTERRKGMDAIREEYRYYRRGRMKLKVMVDTEYYNRLVGAPEKGEAYIIYFLHYQPEATSLPQGGVFVDQELSVAIMARAAKEMGYKLYVKEHFVQPYRNRTFYETYIRSKIIRLIGTDYDSKELVKGSFAALPETGLWCWNRSYGARR